MKYFGNVETVSLALLGFNCNAKSSGYLSSCFVLLFAVPVIQHCDFGIVSGDVLYVHYDETIYYLCICSMRKLHMYICCNYFLDALQYLFLDDDRIENGIDLPCFWY